MIISREQRAGADSLRRRALRRRHALGGGAGSSPAYAAPGILTGRSFAGPALGEAAPLILVGAVTGRLGTQAGLFDLGQLQEKFTAMPIVITTWAGRPQEGFRAATSAAIVILLVVVLLANTAAILLRNRYEKKR